MILDGQNYFSDLANGDAPTAVGDATSAYVVDQQGKNSIFSEGGGAHTELFLKTVVNTAFTSGGSATIQIVLQDSADNSSWADVILGKAIAVADAVAGVDLFGRRLPNTLRRYIRVVYRIGTAAMTAGKVICFLTPEQDLFDASQRAATGTITAPTGALDESTANGVLGS